MTIRASDLLLGMPASREAHSPAAVDLARSSTLNKGTVYEYPQQMMRTWTRPAAIDSPGRDQDEYGRTSTASMLEHLGHGAKSPKDA